MDVAILAGHELKISNRFRDRLCTDTQEATDGDDGRAAGACAVNLVDLFADIESAFLSICVDLFE